MKKVVLGRGLEALIPQSGRSSDDAIAGARQGTIIELPLADIRTNPFQPRQSFDQDRLAELAESIREKGIIQPVIVRSTELGYELIVGERRFRAAEKIGLTTIPAIVYGDTTNEESMELALIENIQREDLNPIEEAEAYRRLISECNLTQADVASKVGKDRTSITNTLRLLTLPDKIQSLIRNGKISAGHARAILALPSDSEKISIAEKAAADELSVRQIERIIYADKQTKNAAQRKIRSAQLISIEESLKRKFGTKVNIMSKRKGGKIVVEYYSNDDLNRILEILGAIDTP